VIWRIRADASPFCRGLISENCTIGIIGGLGPETGCNFCLNINNKFREMTGCQPSLVLDNVAVPEQLEKEMINGRIPSEMLELLNASAERLSNAGADFLVMPCNSVHVFFDSLKPRKPMFSIIEACAEECIRRGIQKAGLLATGITVKEKLYAKKLLQKGIKTIVPDAGQQKELNKIIIRVIHNRATAADKQFVIRVIKGMEKRGAEAVILGCTDFPLLVRQRDVEVQLIDSLEALEELVVEILKQSQPLLRSP